MILSHHSQNCHNKETKASREEVEVSSYTLLVRLGTGAAATGINMEGCWWLSSILWPNIWERNLSEDGIFGLLFKSLVHPGGKGRVQVSEVADHIVSSVRKQMNPGAQHSLHFTLESARNPSSGDGAAQTQGGSPLLSLPCLETASQTHPEVWLPGDSKCSQWKRKMNHHRRLTTRKH